MAKSIENVEIFKTGTWYAKGGKTTITSRDLDEMVETFEAIGNQPGFTPALKLGHSESQKFFGNLQGSPRFGFVEKIWREGEKILANFSQVPDALVDLMKKGRYNSVSVEIFPKYEYEGKTFNNFLTAVALLGAELPAVKGLKDLAASLYTENPETVKLEKKMAEYSQEQLDSIVAAAVAKATAEQRTEFAEELKGVEGKIDAQSKEIDELRTEREEFAEKLKESENESRKAKFEAMVDEAIKDGKVLPKQKDSMMDMAAGLSQKFSEDDSGGFEKFLKDLPKQVDFREHGKGSGGGDDKALTAGEEVDTLAREVMTDKKINYAEARTIVLAENSELKARYLNDPNE